MNYSWLYQLEKQLEESVDHFLQKNPYQESLFTEQKQKDLFKELCSKQHEIKIASDKKRRFLLKLASEIKSWQKRELKAKKAGKTELSNRAKIHLKKLMEKGRQLWSEFDELGKEFEETERKILAISTKSNAYTPKAGDEWGILETEEELNQLRRNKNHHK